MLVVYSSKFARNYGKLPLEVKFLAEQKVEVFKKDPFDQTLQTHKLHGRFVGAWAFSINFRFRIIFEFGENDAVYFLNIGDHDIYG